MGAIAVSSKFGFSSLEAWLISDKKSCLLCSPLSCSSVFLVQLDRSVSNTFGKFNLSNLVWSFLLQNPVKINHSEKTSRIKTYYFNKTSSKETRISLMRARFMAFRLFSLESLWLIVSELYQIVDYTVVNIILMIYSFLILWVNIWDNLITFIESRKTKFIKRID